MKVNSTILCAAVALMGVVMNDAQAQDAEKPDPAVVGYSIGQQFGSFLELGQDSLDLEALIQGMKDKLEGKDMKYTEEECQTAFMSFQQDLAMKQQQAAAIAAEAAKGEGIAFLAANAKREGVTVLPSGLQYEEVEAGTGATPKPTDTVVAHYRGTFIDGEEFDSSYSRGEPAEFPVTRVIPGWTEALQLMKVGAKWKLFIPYELAYGEQGNQGIPGGACLLFDIELVGIK